MNKKIAAFGVGFYPLLTILGIYLFDKCYPFELIHFMGFSSVMYSFLFALGTPSTVTGLSALGWILLFLVGSIAAYVEMIIRKRCKIGFILIIADLIASFGFFLYIIIASDSVGLAFILTGLLIRSGLCAVLLSVYSSDRTGNYSQA